MRRDILGLLTGLATLCWTPSIARAQQPAPVPAVRITEDLTTANVRAEESNLAGLVADAIRNAAKSDVALIAATSFAEVTLPKGDIRADDVLRSLVFRGDAVVVMKLTGAQIRRALEHSVSLYPARSAAFLQVSGLKVSVDPSADRNARIVAVQVGKEPLDEAKTYTVAMPSPLAGGALVYSKAWSRDDIDRDTRKTIEEAIREYLATSPTIAVKTGERIVIKR